MTDVNRPLFAVAVTIREGGTVPGDVEVARFDTRAQADRYVRWLHEQSMHTYNFGPSETLTDAELCREVGAALQRDGFKADGYHTGGGIFCVGINEDAVPGTEWIFGMGDATWAGGLQWVESGEQVAEIPDASGFDSEQYLTTSVASDSQDTDEIAAAISAAITVWREKLDDTSPLEIIRPDGTVITPEARRAERRRRMGEVVAEWLRKDGATWEFPGCVAVPIEGDDSVWFGTANDVWGGTLYDEYGDAKWTHEVAVKGNIASDSTDRDAIVAGIREAVARVKACYAGQHDYDSAENLDGGWCRTCHTKRG